jgi:hypothetical protein
VRSRIEACHLLPRPHEINKPRKSPPSVKILASKKSSRAKKAKPKGKAQESGQATNLVCAECSGKFTTRIGLADFDKEVGKKFTCPNCGAVYELISLQESRITVTILAKGETRTYGKTYDVATKDYALPL